MANADRSPELVTLKAHDFALTLSPDVGGSVVSLTHHDEHILRPAEPDTRERLEMAAFPLVPFSGRIENGCFEFQGRNVQLPANLPPEPHAIHGQGWELKWDVAARSEDAVTLILAHPAGDWPWAYESLQTFTLMPDGLHVELRVTNQSDTPMPAGLGWHPYFPRGDALLTCDVTGYWPNTHDYVPSDLLTPEGMTDLSAAKRVDDLALDNAFQGGGGPACIVWPDRKLSVEITASKTLSHWIIYTPPGQSFFCAEPVSHAPNALNMEGGPEAGGMTVLAPYEGFSGWVKLAIRNT